MIKFSSRQISLLFSICCLALSSQLLLGAAWVVGPRNNNRAWSRSSGISSHANREKTTLYLTMNNDANNYDDNIVSKSLPGEYRRIPSTLATTAATPKRRRRVVQGILGSVAASCVSVVSLPSTAANAATTSDNSNNNKMLQRCDASDRRCGSDGKLREDIPTGKPIPRVTNRITHLVQLIIYVGERREETGALRFGLYGDDCPACTRQILEFLTPRGITSLTRNEDALGLASAPVSLSEGGIVPNIITETAIEFGVPSQAKAYAASRGLMKAGDNFVPQPRPSFALQEKEPQPRTHDVAGLISIPVKGIGHCTTNGNDDEAFLNAFLITANAAPSLDKNRRVIGQVIDDDSMAFLERLATLPTQKKSIPGSAKILPSVSSGPPLLKVTVRDVGVQKVKT